ncbi:MAG: 4-hydroxythreonine-4-phosphate dehydrogenase PdxA [Pseudopelagicola sp.]|nr:4-hydroxythreonine-4-phosphate dehydrogenase PdxA [Pseudopelagicola sp.]
MTQAPIALSAGEPAGIGLEIAEKAWHALRQDLTFFLVGDPRHLPGHAPHQVIGDPSEAQSVMPQALPVLPLAFEGDATPGRPDPDNAAGVIDAIACCVTLALESQASAICTAPIHKKALKDGANFAFPGHTEFLAHLAGVKRVVMMLASDRLRVVPTTIHIPLRDVPASLTEELLETTLRITAKGLKDQFGLTNPRIAVAGLNPHAGEGGAMGQEELEMIVPLLKRLSAEGMNLSGPYPADTMFHDAARARYDVAVCMYHDQALIPIKTLDFDNGVNVTLGLPFIRTSPDHGTAFDIAGTGTANPSSLIEALRIADRMARTRSGT